MTLTHGDSTLAPASGRHCRLRWTTPLACTAICMSGMAAWMQNSGNATRLWLAWVSGRSSGSHIDQGSGRTGGIWIGSPIVNPEMCIARAMAAYHSRRRRSAVSRSDLSRRSTGGCQPFPPSTRTCFASCADDRCNSPELREALDRSHLADTYESVTPVLASVGATPRRSTPSILPFLPASTRSSPASAFSNLRGDDR